MPRAAFSAARRKLRPAVIGVALAAVLGSYLAVTQFTASAAEALLSKGRPATASSVENNDLAASAAVDGNAGTRWSSAFSDPQWLQVDLGSTATVTRVSVNWEAAFAKAFTIQVSPDGSTWTTINTTSGGTGGVQNLSVNGSGRYVRLNATERGTPYGVSLWEFEIFGSSDGAAPPPPPPPPPPPAPAGPVVHVAEFLASCSFSHRLPDDPIVFPGLPGASHMHSFFGSKATNASTKLENLVNSPTTCSPAVDTSSYWVPTLFVDNNPVEPIIVTFYYLGEGVSNDVVAKTHPLPLGLRIVAGNAKATAPDDTTLSRWSCLHHDEVGASHDFVNCPADSMIESYLDFPQCWNGHDLDSPDHKSHMSYPVNGGCPASHLVAVPKLRQVLRFPANGDPSRFKLSSGGGFTMHGDFFNAWPEAEMARRVNDCIRPIIKCGADGHP